MTISVIITIFNDAQYLEQAIISVLEQTIRPDEIIVVDDGSENELASEIIATRFPDDQATLIFVRKANGGPSSARNLGLSIAKSEYVAFLDVDDAWLPKNLEHKLNLLPKDSGGYFGVYGSAMRNNLHEIEPCISLDGIPPVEKIGYPKGFPGGAPYYLFRREALQEQGGFDESLRFNEDFDLILRLIKAGLLCKGDAFPGFIRNYRPDSLTRGADIAPRHQGVMKFLDKAERMHLLPDNEIAYRRKRSCLVMARAMRRVGKPKKEVKKLLNQAFDAARPGSLVEWLAFVYMKSL